MSSWCHMRCVFRSRLVARKVEAFTRCLPAFSLLTSSGERSCHEAPSCSARAGRLCAASPLGRGTLVLLRPSTRPGGGDSHGSPCDESLNQSTNSTRVKGLEWQQGGPSRPLFSTRGFCLQQAGRHAPCLRGFCWWRTGRGPTPSPPVTGFRAGDPAAACWLCKFPNAQASCLGSPVSPGLRTGTCGVCFQTKVFGEIL